MAETLNARLRRGLGGAQRFIFGEGAPDTYEGLQAKRQMAARLGVSAMRTPQNVGEGLSAIGQALASRRLGQQAETGDAKGKAEFASAFRDLLSGTTTEQVEPDAPRAPRAVGPNQGVADDTMAALIKTGLSERGLPDHVADAFVMNFRDESGLNPGINEANPTVPGSRGGFGLAQWTGPRRVALERFAESQGKPASDMNVQLDFLVSELQGPEARAAKSIFSSADAPSAAQVIVRDFLRPAEEHKERRAARYGGVDPQMVEALGNPYASDGQKLVIGQLLQQQIAGMQPPDPMDELELQRAQLELDQMRNPQVDPMDAIKLKQATLDYEQDSAGAGGDPAQFGTTLQFFTDKSGRTRAGVLGNNGDFKEIQPPEGGDWASGIEKVDGGTSWLIYDKRTGQKIGEEAKDLRGAAAETAIGSEIGAVQGQAIAAAPADISTADRTLEYIDEIRNHPGREWGTGFSSIGNFIPGTPGYSFQNRTNQVTSGAFLTAIDEMRGLGALSNAEGQTAKAAVTRMDTATQEDEFLAALADYESIVILGKGRAEKRIAPPSEAAPPPDQDGWTTINGVKIRVKP